MPPTRTNSDASIPKRKPGKPLTACAECRRSKLRCDGQVPCNTCTARGCQSICPDQILSLRKKYTYVLHGTEELHGHIDTLVKRITALENGLANVDTSHSLLAPNLLGIKELVASSKESVPSDTEKAPEEETGETKQEHQLEDLLGTLSLTPSGEATYLGNSARTDYLKQMNTDNLAPQSTLPPSLLELCHTEYTRPDENFLLAEIVSQLPPLVQTIRFCNNYLRHCRYKFSLLFTRDEIFSEIVEPIYSRKDFETPDTTLLAILFCIIAIGVKYSYSLPVDPIEGQDYFWLAVCITKLRPPSKHPTLDNMRLLIYMAYYRHASINEGNHPAWMTINEAVGMAISAGLHINSEHWNLPPQLIEKRHRTFWSLFVTETLLGVSVGRPPTLSLSYVDCPIPTGLTGGQIWIIDYSKVLHAVMTTTLAATTPSYQTVLALDKRVRDLAIPEEYQLRPPEECREETEIVFLRLMLSLYKEVALLFLHKPYFAAALRDRDRLQNHKYMASVTAICRSASRIIKGQKAYWCHAPVRPIVERVDFAWSYTLSAMVALFQIATKAPATEMALVATQSLRVAESLMLNASPTCPFAARHWDLARQMNMKASSEVLMTGQDDGSNKALLDEIDRIAGKTHLSVVHPPPPCLAPIIPTEESYDMGGFDDSRRFDSIFSSVQADSGPVEPGLMHPDLVQDMGFLSGESQGWDWTLLGFSVEPWSQGGLGGGNPSNGYYYDVSV